jgi:hypothetical protein
MADDSSATAAEGDGDALEEESTRVWDAFVNSNGSEMPSLQPEGADGEQGEQSEEGLNGFTPMREAADSISGSSSRHQSVIEQPVVTDVKQGIHVERDPLTGGLRGLPEEWARLLPEGCAPGIRQGEELPPELRPVATPAAGLQLTDEAIVGAPYNVSKWRPQFGLPLEVRADLRKRTRAKSPRLTGCLSPCEQACETTDVNGYEIPLILVLLWRTLKSNGGLNEEGIFRLAPDQGACDVCEQTHPPPRPAPHTRGASALLSTARPAFPLMAHSSPLRSG